MLAPQDEAPRDTRAPGLADAVTLAFGDPREDVFGLARVGLGAEGSNGLGLLVEGGSVIVARVEGGAPVEDFAAVTAAGVRTGVAEPLRRWSASLQAGAEGGFELEFRALSHGAELREGTPLAELPGLGGYGHQCAVAGTVRVGDRTHRVRCLGERVRRWGAPDWGRVALVRTVGAWLGEDLGLQLLAVRPAGARGHDEEATSAWVLEGGPPAVALPVPEALLSTTVGADGVQRRASVELWLGDDEGYPRRAAGEVRGATSFDLGALRMDCAFFTWRMEGREGVGRYDVVRAAP